MVGDFHVFAADTSVQKLFLVLLISSLVASLEQDMRMTSHPGNGLKCRTARYHLQLGFECFQYSSLNSF